MKPVAVETKRVELHGLRDQSYFECLCGTHVYRGSYIISIIGLIFSVLCTLFAALLDQMIVLPFSIISFILYLLVLIAYKQQKPALYLPFIILKVSWLVMIENIINFRLLAWASYCALRFLSFWAHLLLQSVDSLWATSRRTIVDLE